VAEPTVKVAISQARCTGAMNWRCSLGAGTREERRPVQIDFRITKSGRIELFSSFEIHSKPIEQWQPMLQY